MPSLEGGWHFSFQGGIDTIREKIENYSHPEYNTDEIKNNLEKSLAAGIDPLRVGKKLHRIDLDDSFPHLIREEPERFKHMLLG